MRVYGEDGQQRRFNAVMQSRRGSAMTTSVQNTGPLEFPVNAGVFTGPNVDGPSPEALAMAVTIQGGAEHSFRFDHSVGSVQVLLRSQGLPINGTVECLQGPNTNRHGVELYSEDGQNRPIFYTLETPGYGCVVRITNEGPLEFPMTASVVPNSMSHEIFDEGPMTPARIDGVGDVLFIGSRKFKSNTSVYAVVDAGADGVADTVFTIDSGLDQPNGVEWLDGVLYVATARALLRYEGVTRALRGEATHTTRTVLNAAAFPALASLQWHYLRAWGGDLYASNSAGCDHCVPTQDTAAAIVKLDAAQCYASSVYVRGLRFSVGFVFDAAGALFFTNNAHDSIDGDDPYDMVGVAPRAAAGSLHQAPDFGFPHCYTTAVSTLNTSTAAGLAAGGHASGYASGGADAATAASACAGYSSGVAIGSHVAPLGISFRDADTLLIAERGAFGGPPVGHQVSMIRRDLSGYAPLITGFVNASSGRSWGRPVDVQMAPGGGGAFFVSDDKSNSVLRFVGVAVN